MTICSSEVLARCDWKTWIWILGLVTPKFCVLDNGTFGSRDALWLWIDSP